MREGLTYANVVATLALFLAVGGVSYAALTLPRDSVGTAQLRSGAVTLPKLDFPLGIASGSRAGPTSVGTVTVSPCRSLPPGSPCLIPAFERRHPRIHVLTRVTLNLSARSEVLLLGSATFYGPNVAPGESSASVTLESKVGNAVEEQEKGMPNGGSPVALAFQKVIASPAGRHEFALTASGFTEHTIEATDARLVAIALPPY